MFEKPPVRRIDPCSLGKWLNGLDEKDRDNLNKWINADWVKNPEIRNMVIDETGKPFSVDTISDHRQGRCRCSRI